MNPPIIETSNYAGPRITHGIILFLAIAIAASLPSALHGAEKESYYTEPILFHYFPQENKSRNHIGRMGPTGVHLELLKPAFTMHITAVDEGSPAAATGKLKKGQFIESINGQVLEDIDPRIILGNLITEAEATDGKLKLMVKEKRDSKAFPVIMQIPVLGTYSES